MKPDCERFRLLKEIEATHESIVEPVALDLSLAERGQASDKPAVMVHRGCSEMICQEI